MVRTYRQNCLPFLLARLHLQAAQLRLIRAVASMPRKAAAKLITSSKLAPASPARGARPPSPHLEWTQPDLEWTQPHIRILHSNPTRP